MCHKQLIVDRRVRKKILKAYTQQLRFENNECDKSLFPLVNTLFTVKQGIRVVKAVFFQ